MTCQIAVKKVKRIDFARSAIITESTWFRCLEFVNESRGNPRHGPSKPAGSEAATSRPKLMHTHPLFHTGENAAFARCA